MGLANTSNAVLRPVGRSAPAGFTEFESRGNNIGFFTHANKGISSGGADGCIVPPDSTARGSRPLRFGMAYSAITTPPHFSHVPVAAAIRSASPRRGAAHCGHGRFRPPATPALDRGWGRVPSSGRNTSAMHHISGGGNQPQTGGGQQRVLELESRRSGSHEDVHHPNLPPWRPMQAAHGRSDRRSSQGEDEAPGGDALGAQRPCVFFGRHE